MLALKAEKKTELGNMHNHKNAKNIIKSILEITKNTEEIVSDYVKSYLKNLTKKVIINILKQLHFMKDLKRLCATYFLPKTQVHMNTL